MYIVGIIMIAFFAVIGVLTFIAAITKLNTADEETDMTLRNIRAQNAEQRVRKAAKLCDRMRCQHLICRCLDEEAVIICERLRKEYRIIEIERQ